jgi:hypothetical protein
MTSKINFIKLTDQELSTKVALLVLNKVRIIFWKISPRYFEGQALSFVENKLKIHTKDFRINFTGEQICLNFNLNKIEYFIKGKVISSTENSSEMEIELFSDCFKIEKRDFERTQVYPQYEVYAYLKYLNEKPENVFFLNKNEQKKNDIFSNIQKQEKQKLALISPEFNTDENEELIGFRVEDLSSNGLCFLSSQRENEQIISRFINKKFNLILNFEKKNYNLKNVQIIYQVNYINQQFAGVTMFKVGVTFNEDQAMKEMLENLTGADNRILNYPKEFEEFIKNE